MKRFCFTDFILQINPLVIKPLLQKSLLQKPLGLTLVTIMALLLVINGCKSSDPQPSKTMSLKMSITGSQIQSQQWEAKDFLVEIQPRTDIEDEYLWIDAEDDPLINPSKHLSLTIYDYKKTGISTVDHSQNSRQENGSLSFVDISKGSSVDYFGPITYTLTKVEGEHYQGTFSGTLCAYSCLTSVQPINVQGSFDVHIGIQAE